MYYHAELCKEFCTLAKQSTIQGTIALIDSERYYDILADIKSKYEAQTIFNILHHDCVMHIILTRKISWITGNICDNIMKLRTIDKIERFFSFYNMAEIISIINFKYYTHCINISDKYYFYTFIINCAGYNNLLYDFMIDYLATNKISLLIPVIPEIGINYVAITKDAILNITHHENYIKGISQAFTAPF